MKRSKVRWIRALMRDERGLATVEYAIAGALIAVAVLLAFTSLGTAVAARLDTLRNVIDTGG